MVMYGHNTTFRNVRNDSLILNPSVLLQILFIPVYLLAFIGIIIFYVVFAIVFTIFGGINDFKIQKGQGQSGIKKHQ